jgi:hypothetical protein
MCQQTLCGASKAAEEEEHAKAPFPAAGAVDAEEDAARVCRLAGPTGGAAAGAFSAGVDVEGCACASSEFASNSSQLLRHSVNSVSVLVSTDSFGGANSLHSTSICNSCSNSCNSPLTTGGSAATVSTVAAKEKLLEEKLFSCDSDSYTTEAPLTAGSAAGTLGEKEKGFSCDAYTKLTTDATRLEESADESSSSTTTSTTSSFEEEEEVEVSIASPITQCGQCASSV